MLSNMKTHDVSYVDLFSDCYLPVWFFPSTYSVANNNPINPSLESQQSINLSTDSR
jgi:hypothetical protein